MELMVDGTPRPLVRIYGESQGGDSHGNQKSLVFQHPAAGAAVYVKTMFSSDFGVFPSSEEDRAAIEAAVAALRAADARFEQEAPLCLRMQIAWDKVRRSPPKFRQAFLEAWAQGPAPDAQTSDTDLSRVFAPVRAATDLEAFSAAVSRLEAALDNIT